jgi:hypothetical protein
MQTLGVVVKQFVAVVPCSSPDVVYLFAPCALGDCGADLNTDLGNAPALGEKLRYLFGQCFPQCGIGLLVRCV